jgi:hypothetical protein
MTCVKQVKIIRGVKLKTLRFFGQPQVLLAPWDCGCGAVGWLGGVESVSRDWPRNACLNPSVLRGAAGYHGLSASGIAV